MCRVCEKPCWRDGGEAECEMTDAEFTAERNALDEASGVIDLMERLQYSLRASARAARRAEPEGTTTGETKSAGRVASACAMCMDAGCYDGKWCDCATGQRLREREPRGPT